MTIDELVDMPVPQLIDELLNEDARRFDFWLGLGILAGSLGSKDRKAWNALWLTAYRRDDTAYPEAIALLKQLKISFS